MAKRAFVSHITEEAPVAAELKKALNRDFLGMLEVFVSSDGKSISAGEEWLKSVANALGQTDLMMVICSPDSIRRPWINFEAGAAWIRQIPIVPLCHAGLGKGELPMPLSSYHVLPLADARSLKTLYSRVAAVVGCASPKRDFDQLSAVLDKASSTVKSGHGAMQTLTADRAIKGRLEEALNHKKFRWRSLEFIASSAGVSEEVAADLLRADSKVRFSKGKSGNIIVGMRSRVD